jgi:8-oxo-dGTP pyrophosphatase MutT (NUDIX family)
MNPRHLLLRVAVTTFQLMRMSIWFFTRPRAFGAHAVALDELGQVVLVKHTYSRGWRLPGGGVKRGESPEGTILRELREEIGLERYREFRHVYDFQHRPEFRHGTASLFVLSDVLLRPSRTVEIAEIGRFDPAELPADTTELTRNLVVDALKTIHKAPGTEGQP